MELETSAGTQVVTECEWARRAGSKAPDQEEVQPCRKGPRATPPAAYDEARNGCASDGEWTPGAPRQCWRCCMCSCPTQILWMRSCVVRRSRMELSHRRATVVPASRFPAAKWNNLGLQRGIRGDRCQMEASRQRARAALEPSPAAAWRGLVPEEAPGRSPESPRASLWHPPSSRGPYRRPCHREACGVPWRRRAVSERRPWLHGAPRG